MDMPSEILNQVCFMFLLRQFLKRLSSEHQADESVTSGAPYGSGRFWQFTVKQFVSGVSGITLGGELVFFWSSSVMKSPSFLVPIWNEVMEVSSSWSTPNRGSVDCATSWMSQYGKEHISLMIVFLSSFFNCKVQASNHPKWLDSCILRVFSFHLYVYRKDLWSRQLSRLRQYPRSFGNLWTTCLAHSIQGLWGYERILVTIVMWTFRVPKHTVAIIKSQ